MSKENKQQQNVQIRNVVDVLIRIQNTETRLLAVKMKIKFSPKPMNTHTRHIWLLCRGRWSVSWTASHVQNRIHEYTYTNTMIRHMFTYMFMFVYDACSKVEYMDKRINYYMPSQRTPLLVFHCVPISSRNFTLGLLGCTAWMYSRIQCVY